MGADKVDNVFDVVKQGSLSWVDHCQTRTLLNLGATNKGSLKTMTVAWKPVMTSGAEKAIFRE